MSGLAIGIMSGTSLDGADALLADFSPRVPRTLATATVPFSADLREQLLRLSEPGSDDLDLAGECSIELATAYTETVAIVLRESGLSARDVDAIGCHGQTVRHRPERGFTTQLNDPALLAERTGIDVVADFRRRDIAAGGQGAPLAPAFHDAVFRHDSLHRVIANIGGISNATSVRPGKAVSGFDCGPGNVLMDSWIRAHRGVPFDKDGLWASQGNVDEALLKVFLAEPFLGMPPPKSTGRELFNERWLRERLSAGHAPADVQATLLEFTARSIADAIDQHCGGADEVYLCGGGARNPRLAARIAELMGQCPVRATDVLGVPTGDVEAMAFGWLALKCIRREAIDLSSVTGARHACILGAIYPA